jgi:hypothetical protein
MPLDLLKRSEAGVELSAAQHDANFTAIETEVNAKANTAALAPVATAGTYASLTAKPTLGTAADNAETDFATAAQGGLAATALQPDVNGQAIIDYTQPHVAAVSGLLTQSAHGGRPLLVTGNVTVPVTNGFTALIRNKSGTVRTISPASGNLIHEGVTKATISLPDRRELSVHGDGTDVWCAGALA